MRLMPRSLVIPVLLTMAACAPAAEEGPELANAEGKADGEAAFVYELVSGSVDIPDPWFRCNQSLWCDAGIKVKIDDRQVCAAAASYFRDHPEAVRYETPLLTIFVKYGEAADTYESLEEFSISVLRDHTRADSCGAITQRFEADLDGDGWVWREFARDEKVTLVTHYEGDHGRRGDTVSFTDRAGGVVTVSIQARWH
jgi:hypothetical protein